MTFICSRVNCRLYLTSKSAKLDDQSQIGTQVYSALGQINVTIVYPISANNFRIIYYIKVKLLQKLYETIYKFQPQKRKVSMEIICGNTVNKIQMQLHKYIYPIVKSTTTVLVELLLPQNVITLFIVMFWKSWNPVKIVAIQTQTQLLFIASLYLLRTPRPQFWNK